MTEREFAQKINSVGGRAFIVGGWVRDKVMNREAMDKDFVVCHISQEKFSQVFPDAKLVGRSFPVYLVDIDGKHSEVAFGRRDKKTGTGYRGFDVEFDESITIEQDLARRDTTMNAMAIDLISGELIDLYNGKKDIEEKNIRAISGSFCDDPVRAIRAARQAAQLNFSITLATIELMSACREELLLEPTERIFTEMCKALEAPKPSIFFENMKKAELLEVTFPELKKLIGKTQPIVFHPEGDAWNHTMEIVDKVSEKTYNIVARFCALVHDIGKGETPTEMLPHHYCHEKNGLKVLKDWNERMSIPKKWLKAAEFVISGHMRAARFAKTKKIVEFLLSTKNISEIVPFSDLKEIIRADSGELPYYLEQGEEIIELMSRVSGVAAPTDLRGSAIGEWIKNQQIKIFLKWKSENKFEEKCVE